MNTKWMTVVSGHVGMSKDEGFQISNVIETLKPASSILDLRKNIEQRITQGLS